jgi:opacity protein-like surface antigen
LNLDQKTGYTIFAHFPDKQRMTGWRPKMKTHIIALFVAILALMSARAEFFIDVYGGKNSSSGSFSGTYSEYTSSLYSSDTFNSWSTQDDLGGTDGTSLGFRFGYWFEVGLGVALDFSYFGIRSDDSETEINLKPWSFLAMYRYPLLVDDAFPRGRLHPYAGAGISYGSLEVQTDYSHLYDGYDLSENSTCIGFDFRLGLKCFLTTHVAVFGEYRFSALKFDQAADFQTSNSWILPTVLRNHHVSNDGDAQTHHLLGGISYHF